MPDPFFTESYEAYRLSMVFSNLMVDQWFTFAASEGWNNYFPFVADMPPEQPLTEKTFRKALELERWRSVDMEPATRYFEDVTKPPPGPDPDLRDEQNAQVHALLWKLMQGTLTDLTVVWTRGENPAGSEHDYAVPFFLFGRLEDGALVGLRSISVET